MLYSFNKQYPKPLPERVRLEDGFTYTGLDSLSVTELEKLGFVPVSNPPAVPQTSVVEWSGITWTVREKNEDELRTMYLDAVSNLTSVQTQLLRESDWTQLPDTPTDKSAWAAYRQQLRDIKLQPEYPYQVTWPQAPD